MLARKEDSTEAALVEQNKDIAIAIARTFAAAGFDMPFEDLKQEALIGVLLGVRSWRREGKASLRTHARQGARRQIRKVLGEKAGKLTLPPELEELPEDLEGAAPSPEEQAAHREGARRALSVVRTPLEVRLIRDCVLERKLIVGTGRGREIDEVRRDLFARMRKAAA